MKSLVSSECLSCSAEGDHVTDGDPVHNLGVQDVEFIVVRVSIILSLPPYMQMKIPCFLRWLGMGRVGSSAEPVGVTGVWLAASSLGHDWVLAQSS